MFAKLKNIFLIISILAYIGFVFVPNTNAQSQPFQFRVNFKEFANLVYQIDCVNDQIHCQKEDFEALWQKEFLQNEDDKKLLAGWRKVRESYQKSFEIENGLKFSLEKRSDSVNLSDKITIAGLQSKNLEDYQSRLDILVVPRQREDFVRVIKHFEPRFSAWWKREANEKGKVFVKNLEDVLASESIKENIAKFYNFYEPNLPENYVVTFDLIFRPNLVEAGGSGFSLENRLPVEFFFDDDPKRRIGVVIHEFCHFMYYNGLPEKHVAFQNMFLKSGRATAIPAFNLLDEAFASAMGDGIIRRSLSKPENWQTYLARERSFYGKPNIDKAAKAMLPVFDEWLAKGGKLVDEAFVKLYIETMEKTFGERLTSPKFCLSQPFLFIDEKFDKSLRNHFRRSMDVASLYSETGDLSKSELKSFVENQNLNSAFIIQPKSLNQLLLKKIVADKEFKEIVQIYKTERKVLYSAKRNKNANVFIIVAENDEVAKSLIQNLADSPKEFLGTFGN